MRIVCFISLAAFSFSVFSLTQPRNLSGDVAMCGRNQGDTLCSPTPALLELLSLLQIKTDSDFNSIVAATQKAWLRPKGIERWQMAEKHPELRSKLLPLFNTLGMITPVSATAKQYDYVAIHGATLERIRTRIDWLAQQYQKGVRFKKIVFLSGERKLDEEIEIKALKKEIGQGGVMPQNETEMIRWVWKNTKLPAYIRKRPVTWVDAAPSEKRAHTADTVISWLSQEPKPGKILAVSNQPFVSYQDMTMRNKLPRGFTLETVGHGADDSVTNAVYLDNVARLLYEIQRGRSLSFSALPRR